MEKLGIGIIVLLALGLLIVGILSYACEDDWCFLFEWQKIRAADSFERCASLGFPIMESYPRQCRAGDKYFTETIAVQPAGNDMIHIASPLPGALITSPLTIKGEARGNWYFEASFPLKLLDANGKQLALLPVQAKGEWMTTDFVPFEETFSFSAPATGTGVLIFEKDNPSGLPEHDDFVSVPVRFAR